MSEAQEKPKQNDRQISIRQSLGCLGMMTFVGFGLCGLFIMLIYSSARILRTSLDPALIPTAEAFLDVPHEIRTEEFTLYLTIMENYGSIWTTSSADTDVICVTAVTVDSYRSNFRPSATLYVDGTAVMGASDWILEGDENIGNSPYPRWCGFGELQAGLHLIEIQLNNFTSGEPSFVQQWAILIEE